MVELSQAPFDVRVNRQDTDSLSASLLLPSDGGSARQLVHSKHSAFDRFVPLPEE